MYATAQSRCPLCDQEMDAATGGWRCELCDVDYA
jgi:tRNA(Ile2) C34 agmatinyltransferase TiaS